MLAKGNIYQQAVRGSAITKAKRRTQNRTVIKKFLKTIYFITHKKWAVWKNFEEIVELLQNLEIDAH